MQLSLLSSTYQMNGMGCNGVHVTNIVNSFLIWSLREGSLYVNVVPGSAYMEIRNARL